MLCHLQLSSMRVQVLFNVNPVSYTRRCVAASNSDFANNVTPPGSKVPSASSLPGIVSARPACELAIYFSREGAAPDLGWLHCSTIWLIKALFVSDQRQVLTS